VTVCAHRAVDRLCALVLLAPGAASVHAADFDVAEGKLSVRGSVTLGVAYRTVSRDSSLLADTNSSSIGIPGTSLTPTTGRNQDDGNLNYDKWDPVSQVVNGYLSLEYRQGDWVGLASAKAWYDHGLEDRRVPWGNIPNEYEHGTPLSDAGAQQRTRFSGVTLDNLHVGGHHTIDKAPLDWTLGWQKLDWGNRYIVIGGLRDLNPIDIPALTRPGMLQREQETRIPVPQIFARVGLPASTYLEGFYQFQFVRNAPNQCGTFYSGVDWLSDGCNAVLVGNVPDNVALANGLVLERAANRMPSDGGQFGAALTHTFDDAATKIGFYATQFHSRIGYSGVIKSGRPAPAPPFIPGNPDGLNPQYYTEWVKDVRMFGLTLESKFKAGTVFSELTYRPNQPFQFNASDLLGAVVSNDAPTPLRAQVDALPPGGTLVGYERHKQLQFQLGAVGVVPGVLGAAGMNWGAELIYKDVLDLPDPSVTRFGRVDVFGQGPVDGVCPPPAAPTQCSSNGYVSRHAYGYRLVMGLKYADVASGVDLIPSMLFGQDLSGWSGDAGILEGRKLAIVSLRANVRGGFTADVAWVPTWGGTYNNQRDRSAMQVSVGQRF